MRSLGRQRSTAWMLPSPPRRVDMQAVDSFIPAHEEAHLREMQGRPSPHPRSCLALPTERADLPEASRHVHRAKHARPSPAVAVEYDDSRREITLTRGRAIRSSCGLANTFRNPHATTDP